MTRATATETAFVGEVELSFPYRADLVDDLKELPSRYRKWDAGDRVWRVTEPYCRDAIDLLLDRFPDAAVPAAYQRPTVRSRSVTRAPVMPTLPPAGSAAVELPAAVVAVQCPGCRAVHDVPIRGVAELSVTVAKRETTPPELIAICPSCGVLQIVSFLPALAPAMTDASEVIAAKGT